MKIKLHELSEALDLSFSEKDGWVRDVMTRLRLPLHGGISLQLRIEKQKETIFFHGHVMTTLLLACSRCGNDMSYKIDEFFYPVMVQGMDPGMMMEMNPRGDESDVDATYFQGDEIDLFDILHEQMILSLPVQPLCKEDCKGLCPHCGQELNVKTCTCEKGFTSSAFDGLKKFKIKK